MEQKSLNITGTSGTTYDLTTIEADNRTNSNLELAVQVYRYSKGQNANPSDLKEGQVWISKYVG